MKRAPSSGFTTVELLVVLIIIVVLLVIIYPMFTPYRCGSNQTTCINNQRQLEMGIYMSAQDHDGKLPLPQNWIAATGLTGDAKVFDCPTSDQVGTPAHPDYGYNGRLYTLKNGKVAQLTLDDIGSPDQIEATCDIRQAYTAPSGTTDPGLLAQNGLFTVSAIGTEADMRHQKGLVVSYLDGHVQYQLTGEYGRGTTEYNLPTISSFTLNFSKFSSAAKAQKAMARAWGAQPAGHFNPTKKTWELPAGASLLAALPADRFGMTIMVEYQCQPGVNLRLWDQSLDAAHGNIVCVRAKDGKVEFGCCAPANTGGQQLAPQYQGVAKSGLNGRGATFRVIAKLGPLSYPLSKDTNNSNLAHDTSGSLYLSRPGDENSWAASAPFQATAEELVPDYGFVGYRGVRLTGNQGNAPRMMTAEGGPVSIQKLFVSN